MQLRNQSNRGESHSAGLAVDISARGRLYPLWHRSGSSLVPHAGFEMRRRGISRSEVETVVRSPGQRVPSRKGRVIYQSMLGAAARLLLRVVVKEQTSAYVVVTAYKTSKVAKYWKQT